MKRDNKNSKVDFYFAKGRKWQHELDALRTICLSTGLTEELKWGVPCYTHEGANIVLIHDFKEYCALLFFKGAIMKDPKNILIRQTKNVQAARQVRVTSVSEILKLKSALKNYIKEAIQVEKSGTKVELRKTSEFEMPVEFKNALEKDSSLKSAFKALTPGRQRGYLLYFAAAKQSQTREARIKKSAPQILRGKGLND